MTLPSVAIVRTGIANTASVRSAFARIGFASQLIETPEEVERAEYLVLPGVGAFGAGMSMLERLDLVRPLRERIAQNRSTLAICLGMQLLCTSSKETPGVNGLGVIDAPIRRLQAQGLRTPQFGWNRVNAPADASYLRSGYAYYANSFCLQAEPSGWRAAMTTHGESFVAAIERGACLACQFHPELSGAYGSELLTRWIAVSRETQPC